MRNMSETVLDYKKSCELLRGRLAEINGKLRGDIASGENESLRSLEERRFLLYAEIAELEQDIAAMSEYLGSGVRIAV